MSDNRELREARIRAFVDAVTREFRDLPPRVTRRRPTIPAVLWKAGRCISPPTAAVADPAPPRLAVRLPRAFRSLDELVDHLTGGQPETEDYVLQYVKHEPRIAVYLYAPEALALMESA